MTKVWDDGSDQDGIRPENLDLTLSGYTDTPVPEPDVTKDGDNWTYTWEDLPKYGTTGNEIEYQVTEQQVEGYEAPDYGAGKTYAVDGGTITNKHVPVNTSVTVTKAWDDADDQDGLRPDSVTVQLYANEVAYGDAVEINEEDDNWTYTWRGLPKKAGGQAIVYTVDETEVPAGYSKEITGDATTGFTITNKHTPAVIDIKVTKVWDGPEAGEVQAQLYAGETPVGDPVPLNSGNQWTYAWENQPVNASGTAIQYKVDEVTVPTGYSKTVAGNVTDGFTITNKNTEKVEKTVKKVWRDGEDQDGIRPETLSVQLQADGKDYGDPVVLDADHNWIHTESSLPKYDGSKEIDYTWVEDTSGLPEGYEPDGSSVDGNTTTLYNKHNPAKTSVTVTKAWDDSGDSGGVRPSSVSVQLYAGGEAHGDPVTVTSDENCSPFGG